MGALFRDFCSVKQEHQLHRPTTKGNKISEPEGASTRPTDTRPKTAR